VCSSGLSPPPPPDRNLVPGLRAQRVLQKRDYNASPWREKIWMIRTKKFLGLRRGFLFRMVAPLNLVKVNCPSPHDPMLLT
jgi:hypothetical protein